VNAITRIVRDIGRGDICAILAIVQYCCMAWTAISLIVLSSCSPNYEALSDLGPDMTHTVVTDYDRQLTEQARLEWCKETDGACCPERIEVLIGERAGYDRKRLRIWINEEVVSADDWYMASLYAIGFVCGVPESDDPHDAMCGLSISMGLSENDIEAAKAAAR
jgi:hypothetical protein